MPPYQPIPGDIKITRKNFDGQTVELYWHADNSFTLTALHPSGFTTPAAAVELLAMVTILRKLRGHLETIALTNIDGDA